MKPPASTLSGRWIGIAALALLTVLAGWLRFHALAVSGFWIDEAFSMVNALSILEHGYPRLPSGCLAWTAFPVHYLLACGLRLFADMHFGARFFAALAGTLSVPAFYCMNRRLSGSRAQAFAAAFVLAFLGYQVAWSRQARAYVFLQLFTILAVGNLFAFLDRRRAWRLVSATLFMALAVLTHRAGYACAMACGLVLLLDHAGPKTRLAWVRRHVPCVLFCAALCAATAWFSSGLSLGSSLVETGRDLGNASSRNYTGLYLAMLNDKLGLLLVICPAGAVFALAHRPRRALPFLVAALGFLYVIGTRNALFHYRYVLPLIPLVLPFVSYAPAYLFDLALQARRRPLRLLALLPAAGMLALLPTAEMQYRPRSAHLLGMTAPQPDWRGAYAWIADDAGRDSADLRTISTFPMFHDLYLESGTACYLPFSLSGLPDHVRPEALYSNADTVETLEQLRTADAYVVLDDQGLATLTNRRVRAFLSAQQPCLASKSHGRYTVYVWRTRDWQ